MENLFLKFVGITPEGIKQLHTAIKDDALKSQERVFQDGPIINARPVQFANIVSSKLDAERGTYTVEILVRMAVPCYKSLQEKEAGQRRLLFAPLPNILSCILSSINRWWDMEQWER